MHKYGDFRRYVWNANPGYYVVTDHVDRVDAMRTIWNILDPNIVFTDVEHKFGVFDCHQLNYELTDTPQNNSIPITILYRL